MEKLIFMFDGLIYNNKEIKNLPPPDMPLTKNIYIFFFFE